MLADWPLLSIATWLPIIGGVIVLLSGDQGARRLALVFSLATFVATLPLYFGFDVTSSAMQFQEHVPWLPSFNVNYHMGIDGISMPLILLTSFLTVLVVIAGWEVIQYRVSQYMAAFLTYAVLRTMREGYMYDLNRRYYRLRPPR